MAKLEACGWSAASGPQPLADIERLESKIGTTLPPEYRSFLSEVGPGYLDGWAACSFPTPFGDHGITSFYSLNEIEELLDSAIVPRNMICIGCGDFGALTCLSVCGLDRGSIYSLDSEMNFFKDLDSPQQFYGDSLQAREFYRIRDAEELPQRPWGYENCYHVASSFSTFLGALRSNSSNGDTEGEQAAPWEPLPAVQFR